MIIIVMAGAGALATGSGLGAVWRRTRRRSVALRSRFDDSYEDLVALYGRRAGERLMYRSIARFDREVEPLLVSRAAAAEGSR